MPYSDPRNDPDLGRNPPRYRDADDDGFGTGTIVAMVIAGVLVVGGLIYAMSGPSTNTASNPPASTTTTTGQGGTPVNPGSQQNTPNPMPPASPAPLQNSQPSTSGQGGTPGSSNMPQAAPPVSPA